MTRPAQGVLAVAMAHDLAFRSPRQIDVARERFARVELAIARFEITIGRARLVAGVVVARVEIHDGANLLLEVRNASHGPHRSESRGDARQARNPWNADSGGADRSEVEGRRLGTDLLDAYPRLTREDIQADIRYSDAGFVTARAVVHGARLE